MVLPLAVASLVASADFSFEEVRDGHFAFDESECEFLREFEFESESCWEELLLEESEHRPKCLYVEIASKIWRNLYLFLFKK